ncbi:MAG: BolA/IbaG family iron-sulfur metabolism protein [Methylophaga sp.]|nr:BolA/IbaG family iron-sulfur metabolism protein [Methylophaga sp.]
MTDTVTKLQQVLTNLNPSHLEIQDDSALHAGHAGNTGGGHYTITIVSDNFDNLSLLKRHRLVYDTIGTLMKTDVHALSIHAKTPAEFNSN